MCVGERARLRHPFSRSIFRLQTLQLVNLEQLLLSKKKENLEQLSLWIPFIIVDEEYIDVRTVQSDYFKNDQVDA